MAEINWIATTATNFSDASAWDGGVVPGVGDTAVFTNTGSANCTLSSATSVGGLKILADYGGTFSQAGYNMTIGDGGVGKLWILKAATINGTVDFYGDDVAVNASISSTGYLNAHTDATYRQGNTSTWRVTVAEGVTVLQPYSTHPDLGFSAYSLMYGSGLVNNGTVESEVGYNCATFTNNGTFRVTSTSERYVAASNVSMGTNATISGNIAIQGLSSRRPTISPGDYRGFTRIYSTVANNSSFTFSDGEYDLPLFQPGGDVTASANVLLRCAGDIKFLAAAPSFNAVVELTDTNDQDIDWSLVENTVGLSASKTAGNVTLAGGSFSLSDNFTIADDTGPTGSLTITGTASLDGGEYTVTVGGFDSSRSTGVVTIASLTTDGDVDAGATTTITAITAIKTNNQEIHINAQAAITLEKQGGATTIYSSAGYLIEGTTYGLTLTDSETTTILTLSGNLVNYGQEEADTTNFHGQVDANGFRYVHVPGNPPQEQDITVSGTGNETLDFTGAILWFDTYNVTVDKFSGDLTMKTGKTDVLKNAVFYNTVTVNLQGNVNGNTYVHGEGTISLTDDYSTYVWTPDASVTVEKNGYELHQYIPHVNTVTAYGYFPSMSMRTKAKTSDGTTTTNTGTLIYDVNNIRHNAGSTGAGTSAGIY